MAIRAIIAGAILFAGAATGAFAAGTPADGPKTITGMEFNCPIPRGFEAANSMAELPTTLARKYADASPIGKSWNDTDERFEGDPEYGMEFVLHKGRRWIVGLLNSGMAVGLFVEAFDLKNDGSLDEIKLPPHPDAEYCGQIGPATRTGHHGRT